MLHILCLTTILFVVYCQLDCTIYIQKFGTKLNQQSQTPTGIVFSGSSQFINGGDAKIIISYSDFSFFNNETYYGLTQEDGKPATTTCLKMKLFQFQNQNFSNGTQVTDLQITNSSDFQKKSRFYNFVIKADQFDKKLVKTQNSIEFIYNGFYSIAFYLASIDELQYTFYFYFTLKINRAAKNEIETTFNYLSQQASAGCASQETCVQNPDSQVKFCTNFTCQEYYPSAPIIYVNDQIVLQQQITSSGLKNYYLTKPEVRLVGAGFDNKAQIVKFNNTEKGKVIILINADYAFKKVSIQISSTLSDNQNGDRRVLLETTYGSLTTKSEEITCIKPQGQDNCASCEQEYNINGFNIPPCDTENSFDLMPFVMLILLSILIM